MVPLCSFPSSGPQLLLRFTSDASGTSTGFSGTVSTTTTSAPSFVMTSFCPGTASITTSSYSNVSLTSGAPYRSGLVCDVVISSGSPASVVRIDFVDVDFRNEDFLFVYDGPLPSSRSLATVTGSSSEGLMT